MPNILTHIRRHRVAFAVTGLALIVVALSRVNLVSVLVNGLQVGSVYALVALGLALVYKSTRVLNFAQGSLGSVPAFVVFLILTGGSRAASIDPTTVSPWMLLLASVVAVVVGAALAIAVNLFVVQRLRDSSPVITLVATAGVALLFTASELILFEAKARKFPRFVPGAPAGVQVGPVCLSTQADGVCQGAAGNLALGGAIISWHSIILVAVLVTAAVLLALFFRTPPGVALLATAQEPFAAELHGVSVRAMSAIAWGTAGAFGAVAGILGAGVYEQLTPGFMTTTFLIPAIVAAVLGGITSMVGAVMGGLLLGVTVSLANSFVLSYDLTSVLPGPPQIATFAVLLLVLLLRPRGLLGKEA